MSRVRAAPTLSASKGKQGLSTLNHCFPNVDSVGGTNSPIYELDRSEGVRSWLEKRKLTRRAQTRNSQNRSRACCGHYGR